MTKHEPHSRMAPIIGLILCLISFVSEESMGMNHAPPAPARPDVRAGEIAANLERLRQNIAEVLFGKPELIRLALIAVLAEGHILVEDMPGVGKTLLAQALARSLD